MKNMQLKEQTYYLTANGGITYILDSEIIEVYITPFDKKSKLIFNDYNGRSYRPDGKIDGNIETMFDLIAEIPRDLLFKISSDINDFYSKPH